LSGGGRERAQGAQRRIALGRQGPMACPVIARAEGAGRERPKANRVPPLPGGEVWWVRVLGPSAQAVTGRAYSPQSWSGMERRVAVGRAKRRVGDRRSAGRRAVSIAFRLSAKLSPLFSNFGLPRPPLAASLCAHGPVFPV
jgi:hypothetical protein